MTVEYGFGAMTIYIVLSVLAVPLLLGFALVMIAWRWALRFVDGCERLP